MSKFSRMRFHFLLLEMSTKLFLYRLLLSRCCSVDHCVICVASSRCHLSFFALYFMWSSIHRIDASTSFSIFNVLHRLFLRHIACLCHTWDVRRYRSSLIFLFPGPFKSFPLSFQHIIIIIIIIPLIVFDTFVS